MILASIGNAVIDIAAPRKSMASSDVAVAANRPGVRMSQSANKEPRMNGATIPEMDTAAALRNREVNRLISNSVPTRNM